VHQMNLIVGAVVLRPRTRVDSVHLKSRPNALGAIRCI
jgi:hypothetical protein